MKSINSVAELVIALSELRGATFVRLTTATEPKLRKGGNPFVGCKVVKVVAQTCQFGYNYENAVNNRLEKQGGERTFEAESLPWGSWLVPNKLIAHNGKTYGRFYSIPNSNMEVAYFIDNRLATKEEVEVIRGLEPKHTESATQSAEGLTERQVKPMNYNVENIVSLSGEGIRYEVEESVKEYAFA